ncbi:MAG: DUF1223 domain-containing protein [Acidobacteria bacterium]|nr:DUF1223 domain-containing protein [Acidobacteriota bacterium]
MSRTLLIAALALTLAGSAAAPRAAAPMLPVLVELFTSEGCEDCPPADKVLEQLIAAPPAGVEVIGLGEHVDYWDQLGWKDRFSSHALTARQGLYAARFANDSIYTPQMVVDGRSEFVGSDAAAARRAIGKAMAQSHGAIKIDIGAELARPLRITLTITDLPKVTRGDRADIIVAITEDGLRTDVKRGENKGRVLTHAAVARYMATIGEATAAGPASANADITIAPGWQRDRLKIVAFVQERKSRQVLASASAALENFLP